MSKRWQQFHARTRQWAIEANDRWLASLSPDAIGATRNPEAKVVLFGPTQVGKTTLLLTLLGICDEAAENVGSVLRGGRAHGQSSTVLPMRYLRSRDDQWRLHQPDAPGLLADVVSAKLSDIRTAVEDGRYQDTDPVTLFIPACYFSQAVPAVRVSVLDLPGISAASDKERLLVERIARRHLPAAGLILLVGIASSLSAFKPDELGKHLEELKGWVRSPLRYRLVLTYTFQLESMARQHKNLPDLAALRAHFVSEIGAFDFPVDAALAERLYPLEFGASWERRLAVPGAYRDWAIEMRAQGLCALEEDIARSCEGDTRLRVSQEVREQTLWRGDALRQEREDAIRAKQRDLGRCRARVRVAQQARQRWGRRLERVTRDLNTLNGALAGIERMVRIRMARTRVATSAAADGGWALLDAQGKPVAAHVDALTEWLRADEAKLAAACEFITETLNKDGGLSVLAADLPLVSDIKQSFQRLSEPLGEGRYWTWLSGQFVEDCRKLRDAASAHRLAIAVALPTQLRALAEREQGRRARQQREAARRCDSLGKLTHRLTENEAALRVIHDDTRAALRRKRDALRRDQAHVASFDAHMAQAYADEGGRIGGQIRVATRAGDAALALAKLCQLRLTRDALRLICPDST